MTNPYVSFIRAAIEQVATDLTTEAFTAELAGDKKALALAARRIERFYDPPSFDIGLMLLEAFSNAHKEAQR